MVQGVAKWCLRESEVCPRSRRKADLLGLCSNDYQFFPPRLSELEEKGALYLKVRTARVPSSGVVTDELFCTSVQRQQEHVVPAREDPTMSAEELEAERAAEQDAVDTGEPAAQHRQWQLLTVRTACAAEPLTAEEEKEKAQLAGEGFSNWTKREFQAFIRGCELYGREEYDLIHYRELSTTKKLEEVEEYGKVFWERYRELDGEQGCPPLRY